MNYNDVIGDEQELEPEEGYVETSVMSSPSN